MSPILHLFFVIFFCASMASAFSCGSNKFQNWGTEILVKLDCPGRVGDFDSCCKTHDRCYVNQSGRSYCDNTFCSCLDRAAKGTRCGLNARTFCNAVKKHGANAYRNAGKK